MHSLNRRAFLRAVGVGAVAGVGARGLFEQEQCEAASGSRKRPNVVLILVDDLGWADVGCFGSKYYETPHIDRLAREGMRFTDGYAACAVCSPTRAAVMTGRYPARLGVTDWIRAKFQRRKGMVVKKNPTEYVGGRNRKVLCPPNAFWMELEEVTIAEALKPAGYVSCHIGKWHLGDEAQWPERQGFDYNFGGCDFGQPPTYFDPYTRGRQGSIPTLKPRKKGEFLTDREGDEAAKFIARHKDRPFFLYMAHYAVHTPIMGKADVIAKYKAKKPHGGQKNATYAALVESVDDAVGRIVSALDAAGVADNTIVIFTSDNGGLSGPTSNAPLRAGKGTPYEGGIREPTIVRWPGVVRASATCDVPITSVDYLPTVCEAAGVKPPPGRAIDGESILPLLKQTGALKRDAIYWHFPHYRGRITPYSIIRAGPWKLLKRYDGKPYELFNLKDDLSETTDLSDRMPEKVQQLDARLVAWLKHVGAKVPRPNPDYEPPKRKKQ